MQLAAMFFRLIMKIRIIIWVNFPRDVSAVVTEMDTLNQFSRKRLALVQCAYEKKAVNKTSLEFSTSL